jgi:signal transduction histidine kinase
MLPLDARMFKQAELNLLSNAIKYTPERGRVLLEAVANEDVVHVRVQDSGIGIPADQQDRLFNKFFRAENAIASGAEGTGLGLYVVKKIVEQAGGTIAIESAQGQGSTFTVTLPLKRA